MASVAEVTFQVIVLALQWTNNASTLYSPTEYLWFVKSKCAEDLCMSLGIPYFLYASVRNALRTCSIIDVSAWHVSGLSTAIFYQFFKLKTHYGLSRTVFPLNKILQTGEIQGEQFNAIKSLEEKVTYIFKLFLFPSIMVRIHTSTLLDHLKQGWYKTFFYFSFNFLWLWKSEVNTRNKSNEL